MMAQKLKAPALSANNGEGVNIIQLEQAKNSTKTRNAIIPIDDNHRLTGNSYCWQVERVRKRGDVFSWEVITWHRNIGEACNSLCGRLVRTSGAYGVAEVLLAQEVAVSKLTRALSNKFNVAFHCDE